MSEFKSGNPESNSTTSQSRRFWAYLKWPLFLIVLVFIARRAVILWQAAPPQSVEIHGVWLIPASVAYFIGWLPCVWFWRCLLRDMGYPISWWDAVRAYFVGHLGKYVPGKAMVLVIRGSLVQNANPMLAGLTAAYETLVFMAAGVAIAVALAPSVFQQQFESWLPIHFSWLSKHPVWVPVIVAAATFATTPLSAWLFTKIGQKSGPRSISIFEKMPAISAMRISQGVIVLSFGWFCHALSLGFVILSVSSQPMDFMQFPQWLGACTLSTVGGFIILIAPGGIGVREGLLIESLKDQPHIGPTLAVVIAGLLRAVWFTTELVAAGLFFVTRRKTDR